MSKRKKEGYQVHLDSGVFWLVAFGIARRIAPLVFRDTLNIKEYMY
jgi:hypothetical protein